MGGAGCCGMYVSGLRPLGWCGGPTPGFALGCYVVGLTALVAVAGWNLGLRPRLLWNGPSALKTSAEADSLRE